MKITFRHMNAAEAWSYIEEMHDDYHGHLKNFGYEYKNWIPNRPELQEMFESAHITSEMRAKYRDLFINYIYKEQRLHRLDDTLATVAVPTLHRVVETLAPFAKKWGVKFPDSVEILTTYGYGGSYEWGDNPKIIFRMTQYLDEYTPGLLLHEFIHLLIEQPIIQKYNVPQDLKERIVDIIGFEYFGRPVQSKYENSFANNYITRSVIENDLPGAVQKMMAEYNGLQATKQQGFEK